MKRVLLLIAVCAVFASVVPVSAVTVGNVAPDFQGKTLDGKDFKLSDFKGQPILLKIGTTWCPSCRVQTKAVDTLHQYFVEKGVRFVDVFIDESEKSVRKYFDKGGYNDPAAIVLDEDNEAYKAYNVYVIPRLILIDKDFVVHRDSDTISARNLKKKIEKMLGSD